MHRQEANCKQGDERLPSSIRIIIIIVIIIYSNDFEQMEAETVTTTTTHQNHLGDFATIAILRWLQSRLLFPLSKRDSITNVECNPLSKIRQTHTQKPTVLG